MKSISIEAAKVMLKHNYKLIGFGTIMFSSDVYLSLAGVLQDPDFVLVLEKRSDSYQIDVI